MLAKRLAAVSVCLLLARPTQAGIVTNGDFTSYTNNSGQAAGGFQIDYNGTLTGWTSNTNGTAYYSFLFVQPSGNSSSNTLRSYGQYGGLNMWSQATGGGNTWDGNGPTRPGGGTYNYVALDGAFNTGPLSQTLTGLTVGDHYAVSFYYAFAQQQGFDGLTNQNLFVSLGSQKKAVLAGNYVLANHGFSGWAQAVVTFTATSATQALSFLAYGAEPVPPFALLASVSVTNVPEPGAIGLMLTGIGATLAVARRRRARLGAGRPA